MDLTIEPQALVAKKISNDMIRWQRLIARGIPTQDEISRYSWELAELFAAGYLNSVYYGFVRNDSWVFGVQYKTSVDSTEAGAEEVYVSTDFPNSVFSSFISYQPAWNKLSPAAQTAWQKRLKIQREPSVLPKGQWDSDTGYNFAGRPLYRKALIR